MRYICTNCRSYIYDEALGDKGEDIKRGTKFEDISQGFLCPACYESSDFFHEIKDEINYPMEDLNMTALENEHSISCEVQSGVLSVNVGGGKHPMLEDHFIASVGLYDESGELIEEKFMGPDDDSIVDFDLDYLSDFEVRVKCSEHGIWGSKIMHL